MTSAINLRLDKGMEQKSTSIPDSQDFGKFSICLQEKLNPTAYGLSLASLERKLVLDQSPWQ